MFANRIDARFSGETQSSLIVGNFRALLHLLQEIAHGRAEKLTDEHLKTELNKPVFFYGPRCVSFCIDSSCIRVPHTRRIQDLSLLIRWWPLESHQAF